MVASVLSLEQLNRTLLARQLLLKRSPLDSQAAIEKLVALQSQIPNPPYIGLWTRLQSFERQELTNLLETRQVMRAPWLPHLAGSTPQESLRLRRPSIGLDHHRRLCRRDLESAAGENEREVDRLAV